MTLPSYATISAFGDSITAGSLAVTASNRWANRLATALGATLLNAGISGTVLQNSNDAGGSPRIDNGRDRYAAALTGANKRAACFIAYGFNDARYIGAPATLNVANYKNDYREVLNGLLSLGGFTRDTLYIGSPYYITDTGLVTGTTGFSGQTRAGFAAYVTEAQEVAAEYGLPYCDLYAALNTPEWIANITASDQIHPDDAGHAMVATAWQTKTLAGATMNGRAAPATVGISVTGTTATVTASATTGAASYEYALLNGGPLETATNTTGIFTGVAPGTYYSKARAVFADGSKGPWTFATASASVAAPSGLFAQANFTDTAGTNLTVSAPEIGGPWILQPGETTSAGPKISAAGRVYQVGTKSVMQLSGGVPASADYYVRATFVPLTIITGNSTGLAVRMQTAANTAYWGRYVPGTGWQIWKTINGTSFQLGSTNPNPVLTAGGPSADVTLEASGSADPLLVLTVNGEAVVTAIDSAGTRITAAGRAGMRSITGGTLDTSATGIHMGPIKAETQLNYPRIGLIGPSLTQQNNYGSNTSSSPRAGNAASGALTWALMADRRAFTVNVGSLGDPYFTGDNRGQNGGGFAEYPAQITALNARMADIPTAQKIVMYEPGRNDIQQFGMNLTDYQTNVIRDIAALRAGGYAFILIAKIWKKPIAFGAPWNSGGAARTTSDAVNAWLETYVVGQQDLRLIDYPAFITDPGSPDGEPYAGVTRSDYTHFTAKGARRGGKAVQAVLRSICTARTYPTAPAESLVSAFTGTAGAVSGGVSGPVFTGWTATQSAAGATIVAAQPTIDGKPYQRFTFSAATGVPSTGINLTLTNTVTLASTVKQGMRVRVRIPASLIPYQLFFSLGTSTQQGASPSRRSGLIAGVSDVTDQTIIGGAGADFAASSKFPGDEAVDLWLESSSPVIGGGGAVGISLVVTIGTAPNSGDTLVVDIGEIQTFAWHEA